MIWMRKSIMRAYIFDITTLEFPSRASEKSSLPLNSWMCAMCAICIITDITRDGIGLHNTVLVKFPKERNWPPTWPDKVRSGKLMGGPTRRESLFAALFPPLNLVRSGSAQKTGPLFRLCLCLCVALRHWLFSFGQYHGPGGNCFTLLSSRLMKVKKHAQSIRFQFRMSLSLSLS